METEVAALPDDALAGVLHLLPPRSLAVSRCVCKAWCAHVDARALLHPHLLPHSVRGIFVNYIDHGRPHHFARPSSPSTFPTRIDGMLGFFPHEGAYWWSVLDHCNGLLLCNMERMQRDLCVCNPATRRWTLLPWHPMGSRYEGTYLVFDPAVSPHYEVFLIPDMPKKPEPKMEEEYCALLLRQQNTDVPSGLALMFSSLDDAVTTDETEEEEFQQPADQDKELDSDPCCLMEWPPIQWSLNVFSSRTGRWEDRTFVREGEPAGIVQDMWLDGSNLTYWGLRQHYAVYWQGMLYVHCQGGFVARFSLSNDKYKVIKTPANIEHAKPYLGRSEKGLYFGILHDCQLWVWILNESCGQMEWALRYRNDLRPYAQHVGMYSDRMDGAWFVEETNTNVHKIGDIVETRPKVNFDWDSDHDDTFAVEDGSEEYYVTHFDIFGFHPYKKIVFIAELFDIVAYHLNSSKIQYLGYARPRSYRHNHTNGTYESFVYTPCMIGELDGDSTSWSSSSC